MTMMRWGRLLLMGGVAGLILSLAPMLLLAWLAAGETGLPGLIAVMLTLSVTPLAAATAMAGGILVVFAYLRGDRS